MKLVPDREQSTVESAVGVKNPYPSILAYGFRPFFLLAALYAAISVPLWVALLHGRLPATTLLPLPIWHAHEMLFGFIAAAVAGFLLTAVPSWTGQRGYAGAPLLGLTLLWMCGRVAMSSSIGLEPIWAAAIDLAFIPVLALTVLPALLRSGNRRNLVFIGLLLLLFGSNLHFHFDIADSTAPLTLGFNVMLFMVAMLGGRVVPAFTSSALKQQGQEIRIKRYQPIDRLAQLAIATVLIIDLVAPDGIVAGIAAGIAALLLGLQLFYWQGTKTLGMPLVWILQLAYLWLPVGLALKAAWLLGAPIPSSSWLHALTSGAFATMIMAIMSRAALGHTGRELVAPGIVVIGYYLLTLAALARVFGPWLLPGYTSGWWIASAALWSLAFIAYLVVYAPILCRARIDGRPG